METNRKVTVWYDFKKCEQTGRIANFEIAGGLREGGFEGIFFNDSDVMKVIEGAAYALAIHPDPKLEKYLGGITVLTGQAKRMLYRSGDVFKPVEPANGGAYGIERDRFNAVSFKSVTTDALRIEATLRDEASGGILEWRVE